MQTQLWCARCDRSVDIELKLKKMGRGKIKLAQLLSVCPNCRSTLHTQTMRLDAAEDTLRKFQELRGEVDVDEGSAAEGSEAGDAEE